MAPRATDDDCWRGRGSDAVFVPGLPGEVPAAAALPELFEAMACCTRCELALERTQVVPGVGPADARVMLLGEAPGAQEDRAGEPFVGRAGKLLDQLLAAASLRRSDVFITNVVACRPPKNRNPRAREVRAHAPWLDAQLRLVRPEVVVTLGSVALKHFVKAGKITELHGAPQALVRGDLSTILLPTYHPAAALRRRELRPVLEADLARLPGLLE